MNGQTAHRYARIAGVLLLFSIIAGSFGEAYVPAKLVVSGDATATAANLRASDLLFRAGFASYLVEAVCDIALALVLYVLLKPVQRDLALLAAFFGLVSTAVFACAQLFHFAALLFIGDADYLRTFSPEQLNTLMLLSLKFAGYGGGIFMVFYGVTSVLRGYLLLRSGYLPKFLGALLFLAGLGFIAKNFLLVLAPSYASDLFLLPMFIAIASLAGWLLIKGVDVAKWPQRDAA